MRKSILTIAILGAAMPYAMAQDQASSSAAFLDADGKSAGTATIRPSSKGVLFEIEIKGLPPNQWLALHLHEKGECDPKAGFKSAGGHFNPADQEHGYLSKDGPHAGDMPNQYISADGVLRAHVFNSFVRAGKGDNGISGRAIMVHGGTDDYSSQPTGDAGHRLACAVIK